MVAPPKCPCVTFYCSLPPDLVLELGGLSFGLSSCPPACGVWRLKVLRVNFDPARFKRFLPGQGSKVLKTSRLAPRYLWPLSHHKLLGVWQIWSILRPLLPPADTFPVDNWDPDSLGYQRVQLIDLKTEKTLVKNIGSGPPQA